MPWRKRGRTIPASCAELDLEAAGRELIRVRGDVSAAARALGVPAHDLRLLTWAVPELIDAALEAQGAALDEAQAQLIEAMEFWRCAAADQGGGPFSARHCGGASAWVWGFG